MLPRCGAHNSQMSPRKYHRALLLSVSLAALLLAACAEPVNVLEVLDPEQHASPGQAIRRKVKLFVGIPSQPERAEYRQAARETWMQVAKASQGAARFFIYVEKADEAGELMQQLREEHDTHRDTVILTPEALGQHAEQEVASKPTRMAHIMMAMFQTAMRHFDAEFVMRANDDGYVNIPIIMHMLTAQRQSTRAFWYGNAKPGFIIDPNKEGHLPKYKDLMRDSIFQPVIPQYMDGVGVLMSAKVVKAVVVANRIVGLRMLHDDDVGIGLWLAAFDMHYLNETEAGCSVRAFPPLVAGKDEKEWGGSERDALCMRGVLPLAVVHPCKTPEAMKGVFQAATGCKDTLTYNRKTHGKGQKES